MSEEKLKFTDLDCAHHVAERKPKIYESPDKGQTVYEREFGSSERTIVKTAVQMQWNNWNIKDKT